MLYTAERSVDFGSTICGLNRKLGRYLLADHVQFFVQSLIPVGFKLCIDLRCLQSGPRGQDKLGVCRSSLFPSRILGRAANNLIHGTKLG